MPKASAILAVAALAVVMTACSNHTGRPDQSVPVSTRPVSSPAMSPSPTPTQVATPVSSAMLVPTCPNLIGQPAERLAGGCGQGNDIETSTSDRCVDGSTLYYTNTLWGISGGVIQAGDTRAKTGPFADAHAKCGN